MHLARDRRLDRDLSSATTIVGIARTVLGLALGPLGVRRAGLRGDVAIGVLRVSSPLGWILAAADRSVPLISR